MTNSGENFIHIILWLTLTVHMRMVNKARQMSRPCVDLLLLRA